ncbi:Cof-type HAD-IIB family hydrolase [Companilactobacillus zhachilii]|uniref:Cof-type HAD-IIB family hydrolase n=1 Tax=Companilactobacillus zhachilii TaxID=2304606 RepID=UPI004034BD51
MDIKLILSDIDGTILNDENVVDSGLKSVISELRQQGIPFVLASARSPEGMLPIAKELDVMDNPIACYNGALVVKDLNKKDYTTILSHELEIEEVRQVVQIVHQRFPNVSINLYSGSDWYVERRDKWTEIESEITQLQPIITDLDQFVSEHQSPIHKLLLISEPKEIEQVLGYLRNAIMPNSSFYLSKPNYLEITNSHVSKEKALRELAKVYNLSLDKTMALGDNFNDVPMLKLAGLGVAMQNAPTEVRNCAKVITKSNNQNGVSKAIEKYVLK